MKRRLISITLLFLMSVVCFAQTEDQIKNSKRASTNVQNAQFPRITPDLKVIYKIKAPEGQKFNSI